MRLHQNEFLERALAEAAVPMYMMDRVAHVQWANKAYCNLVGKTTNEILNKVPYAMLSVREQPDLVHTLWDTLHGGNNWEGDLRESRDGVAIYIHSTITPLPDARGNPAFFLVFQQDITTARDATAALWHTANHDSLTSLANRALFSSILDLQLTTAKRNSTVLGVLFIDLDKFKPVNDTYGHHIGDCLLKHAADVIKCRVRESDTVARFGGDEFGVILPDVGNIETAKLLGDEIVHGLCQPTVIESHTIVFGGSVGIAVYPRDGDTLDSLVQSADRAMYAAKSAGRNCCIIA